jgi:hypothetical protein
MAPSMIVRSLTTFLAVLFQFADVAFALLVGSPEDSPIFRNRPGLGWGRQEMKSGLVWRHILGGTCTMGWRAFLLEDKQASGLVALSAIATAAAGIPLIE